MVLPSGVNKKLVYWLSQSPDGSNLSAIFDTILSQGPCEAVVGSWVSRITPEHLPDPQPGPDAGTFGYVRLVNGSGDKRSMPLRHDPTTGDLTYRFDLLPQGTYTLSGTVFYKGDVGVTRRYDLLRNRTRADRRAAR